MCELGLREIRVLNIYCDNMSIMKIVLNLVMYVRIKCIEVYYYFIREKVNNNKIKLLYILSINNLVDMLIKFLGRICFNKFKE